MGDPKLSAEDQMTLFAFDGRKLHHVIRKPTEKDSLELPAIEITAPVRCEPKAETFMLNRKEVCETLKKVPMEE